METTLISEVAADTATAPLTCRMLDAAGLQALDASAWERLAAAALVENPFYARQYVLAGLETLDRSADLRALAITAGDGTLAGLFPFHHRGRVPAPFARFAAANNYQFCGTPLVHRDHAAPVVGAWLDFLARSRLRSAWVLSEIDLDTPLAGLILAGVRARGLPVQAIGTYERAYLTRLPGGFEGHLETVLSKNRLKDVRRTMRRLEESGTIALEHVEDAAGVARRLEDFLALEHAGWKGQARTSFLSHADDAAFARQAYRAPLAALDSLLLDGRPIAMKLSIRSGPTAFTPKIAYDETYRKLGPGMALEYLLIQAFYASSSPTAVDAAATADGHSALNFFNEHKRMGTLLLGRWEWQVRVLATLFAARERLKTGVDALRQRRPAATPARAE